jgi:hypothetical protein
MVRVRVRKKAAMGTLGYRTGNPDEVFLSMEPQVVIHASMTQAVDWEEKSQQPCV